MSQALSALITNSRPSPLQREAIKRIQEFGRELKENGYTMRTGMELEFMLKDSRGALIPAAIDLKKLNAYIATLPDMPYLHEIKTECTAGYEAIMGDMDHAPGAGDTVMLSFSPLKVATTAAHLKAGMLKDMLLQSGCFTPPPAGREFSPTFHAYPYAMADKNATLDSFASKSSSLHINVSLYDQKGNNAFATQPAFMRQCAQNLVHIQKEGALAFMPNNNSLQRLGSQAHVSVPSGFGMDTIPIGTIKRYHSSVNLRGACYDDAKHSRSKRHHPDIRIENRLSGADADPYVALAVTMAALVQAVREKKEGPKAENPRFALPESRSEMAAQLESSFHLRQLLGPQLHAAILQSYHPENTRSL